MRPFLYILGLLVVCIGLAAYTSTLRPHTADRLGEDTASHSTETVDPKTLLSYDKVTKGAIQATLEIEGRGAMTLELYPQAAPETVMHIQELCKLQFYNGI